MHLCVIYDCLYPHTVGGGERWYRELALEAASAGQEVTYLTRQQWDSGEEPDVPGVRVVAVSRPGPLYTADGRRRIAPALEFGAGVLRHLLRNRAAYDAVYAGSFPFFGVLGMRAALARTGVQVGVDWLEAWTPRYWREYLGTAGLAGLAVQRMALQATPRAFVHSDMNRRRLREEGYRGEIVKLPGLFHAQTVPAVATADAGPLPAPFVLFAGRLIREKQVHLLPEAVLRAREVVPDLRAVIVGDGPERARVAAAVEAANLRDAIELHGFVEAEEVARLLRSAACLVLPSAREGYGMVVVEAAAAGTPSVVLRTEESAASELIAEGENGHVVASPDDLGPAIARTVGEGAALRDRTAAWFAAHADAISAAASARVVLASYAAADRARS